MAARSDEVDDLCLEPSLTADHLASRIRGRFLKDQLYTYVSPFALLSINPCKIYSNYDNTVFDYVREGFELQPEQLPPHPAQLAARAFYYMRRTQQDQTIVLQGKSNSGKSFTRHLLAHTLVQLGNTQPGKKHSKLTWAIPAAETLLNAFGNAGTLANPNASKFGSYVELQYKDKSRLVGFKSLTYHFDTKRVSGPSKSERNFHIFYYLLAGASPEEATHLGLDVSHQGGFHALLGACFPSNNAEDAEKYKEIKEAFRAMSFSKRVVSSLLKILAAILHLGQITFEIDQARSKEAAVVYNRDELILSASLLGVTPEDLEAALQVKTIVFGFDRVTSFLHPEAASENRDELSRALYGLLFAWLTDYINLKTSKADFKSFISIVDLPGMQMTGGARSHGLDDFCFNLASERMHSFVTRHYFVKQKAQYEQEGVDSLLPGLQAGYFDNAECIHMLTTQPGGVVHIIDDQSRRKGKTDSTMLDAIGTRWGNHAGLGWRAGDESYGRVGTFSINHYDGQVTYSIEAFCKENRAAVSTDFVTLLAGQSNEDDVVGGSSDAFINELFSRELAANKAEEDSAVTDLKSRASVKRNPTIKGNQGQVVRSGPIDMKTVVRSLNQSLDFLFEALNENRIWLLVCLKPNEAGLPNHCDVRLIKSQLGSSGVAELAHRLQRDWSITLTHKEFWSRYAKIEQLKDTVAGLHTAIFSDKALGIRAELGWSDFEMAVGKFKVFLAHSSFRFLEDYLRSQDTKEAALVDEKVRQATEGSNGLLPTMPMALHERNDSQQLGHSPSGSMSAMPLVMNAEGIGYSEKEGAFDDGASLFAPSTIMFKAEKHAYQAPMPDIKKAYLNAEKRLQGVEMVKTTKKRRVWVAMTWLASWWVPGFLLTWFGRMKRGDMRMAWREKVLIKLAPSSIVWPSLSV